MRIFGIGLPRTGTTSLSVACLALGFRTCHCVYNSTLLESADAFFDCPIFADFRELDEQYPGSRFILSIRNEGSWLHSIRTRLKTFFEDLHFQRGPEAELRVDRVAYRRVFGTLLPNDDELAISYRRHVQMIRGHFAMRSSDLLEIDVSKSKQPWRQLACFLGKAAPTVSFPYANKSTLGDWDNIEHSLRVDSHGECTRVPERKS